jgi:hypothetical protein
LRIYTNASFLAFSIYKRKDINIVSSKMKIKHKAKGGIIMSNLSYEVHEIKEDLGSIGKKIKIEANVFKRTARTITRAPGLIGGAASASLDPINFDVVFGNLKVHVSRLKANINEFERLLAEFEKHEEVIKRGNYKEMEEARRIFRDMKKISGASWFV